jgi:hypothetical protein
LGSVNIIIMVCYFGILVLMGWFFSTRQKSTNDYFRGGGRVPWWAAGLSIFGTALSAITFMAIPAKAYATDWSYIMLHSRHNCSSTSNCFSIYTLLQEAEYYYCLRISGNEVQCYHKGNNKYSLHSFPDRENGDSPFFAGNCN